MAVGGPVSPENVELFQIDIETNQFAAGWDIQLERIAMLNDSPPVIDRLKSVLWAPESSLFSNS